MADDIKARIEKALDEQDSTDFNTPSGATLTLMSELLDEDNLQGFSCVYLAYSHRHASNAGFIKNRMPAKIRNFLITHRAIDPTSLTEWTNNNPDWEDALMLWDCGHKTDPENRPSKFLPDAGIFTVHRMFITNYDEDHISDLPNLRQTIPINILLS